jgi:hypothetical protein
MAGSDRKSRTVAAADRKSSGRPVRTVAGVAGGTAGAGHGMRQAGSGMPWQDGRPGRGELATSLEFEILSAC